MSIFLFYLFLVKYNNIRKLLSYPLRSCVIENIITNNKTSGYSLSQ
uniref:Uncharacterized protein n=1 Tax=Anguilla anguilla TaxID=7936 RepID=A0A0E9RE59_ANGAN